MNAPQPVKSSLIRAVSYEGDTLEIEFVGGGTYQYFNVPLMEYEALMAAPSVGKHFTSRIKGKFLAQKKAVAP